MHHDGTKAPGLTLRDISIHTDKPNTLECDDFKPHNSQSTTAVQLSNTKMTSGRSSFLGLPPEVRNQIYGYVLTNASEKVGLSLVAGTNARWYEQRRKNRWRKIGMDTLPTPLALIVTCKQVYNEARLMIYAKLPFFIGEIPMIPREPGVDDSKIAANMRYRQALFKALTDSKIPIGLKNMQRIQHLEFIKAKEFMFALRFKADMDDEFGSAGPADHDLVQQLTSGVRSVTVHTTLYRTWLPLKFGFYRRDYTSFPVGKLRDTFPKLEKILVKGPGWEEITIVTDETSGDEE